MGDHMDGNTHVSFVDSLCDVFYFSDDLSNDDPIVSGDSDVLNNLSVIRDESNGVIGRIKFRHFCPTYNAAEFSFISVDDALLLVNGEMRIRTKGSKIVAEVVDDER